MFVRLIFIILFQLTSYSLPVRVEGMPYCQVTKQILKKTVKKSAKASAKKGIKKSVKEQLSTAAAKSVQKNMRMKATRALTSVTIEKKVLKSMTKEQQELFLKKGYRQITVSVNGKNKALLISKEFDPNLKISRNYTGDFNPVDYHKGDPRYVIDGCETNLGRMKRGLAPLYKDPTNKNPKWHGYSEFEVHHGGQKADPEYFALMGKEHETYSKVLHTTPHGTKSEIDRAVFSTKERAPMYKKWAEQLSNELFSPSAVLK